MKKQITGFSLIELLIAVAVVAIGLAVTVPAMRDFTNQNRQVEQINKLVRDLNFAKSEAATRGSTITVAQTGSTDGNWYDGWSVKSGATDLRVTPALGDPAVTPPFTLLETNGHTSVQFRSTGRAIGFIDTTSDGNDIVFRLCDANTEADNVDKELTVNDVGRLILDAKFDCP